jgi:hypothetical protein
VHTSCTSDSDCATLCTATCNSMTSPRALVDRAHPSTCGEGSVRICTPCTCIPQGSAGNECVQASGATTCRARCGEVCGGYNARRDTINVSAIICPAASAPAAPSCVAVGGAGAPAAGPGAGTSAGYCRFACSFGATRNVRTNITCTPSSPSECSTSGIGANCTALGAGYTASTHIACEAGEGGPKCVITCNRSTVVAPELQGTCNAGPGATRADGDQCLNRCQTVCGNRGMVCNTDSAGTCTAGHCAFSCAVATTPAIQDNRETACSYSDSASQGTANQLCSSRCTAFCSTQGGTCAGEPAASCYTSENRPAPGGADNSAGGSAPAAPRQPARTAPVFNATFPDPFGGNLTVPQVIGNIIRILVGLTGVFFLGVFVYGGLLYLTSAGDPKAVQKGQAALVNAVIGLVVVLFSFVAVSLIVQVSDRLQNNSIGTVDQSQNAQDDSGALQPGGTTRATGRSSQGGSVGAGAGTNGTIPPPEAGSPGAACRNYYGADPATCSGRGGACPAGVSDLGGLVTTWGTSFPAATPSVPDPAAACRTCLETGVTSLQGRFPGIQTSCIPALVHLWSTSCRDVCNPRAMAAESGNTTRLNVCDTAGYNINDASCQRCMTYWQLPAHVATISGVGCQDLPGKAAIWCSGAESPARTRRPESGGYCTPISTPR